MRKLRYALFLSLCFSGSFLSGEVTDLPSQVSLPPVEELLVQGYHQGEEEQMLESLIALTQDSLGQQEELLQDLRAYNALQSQFVADRQDRRLAYQYLKSSKEILKKIEEARMQHLFRKEFLEELAQLAEITSAGGEVE